MKIINKNRFINKYNLFSFLAMLLLLWISWAFCSYFIEILTMDYYAPDLAISTKEEAAEARYKFIIGILSWETYIDSSMNYTVYVFPLFSLIPVIPFCDELKGYYSYTYRFMNYNRSLISGILFRSFISACITASVFVVFFSVGNIFMLPQLSDIGGYASVLPEGFYHAHPYLFFLFMTFTIYYAVSFTFALLGCAVALCTRKKYCVIIIPMLMYIGDAYIIGGSLGLYKYQIFSSVCAFNTIYSTGELFIPLIPFLLISVTMITIHMCRRKCIRW